ncbi:uncharacterized protein LOC121373372 [Gigantopelta aegis]|uniref:uncharacterized protein LOC121373372 n=1 Tax=Gigantopelta aegis TaxID=1735272 RepID=UPI001B889E99|nr:uncharacterized protein LOC121373372 [Gigantopelta aegis]
MAGQCPVLAVPPNPVFISLNNMNMTLVSTFKRTVGTKVTFTCHVPQYYKLQGAPVLTCLQNSQWDHPAPTCVSTIATTTVTSTATTSSVIPEDEDVTMLPFIIAAVLMAAALILTAITLLIVLLWKWKRRVDNKHREKHQNRNNGNLPTASRLSNGLYYQPDMLVAYPYVVQPPMVEEYPYGTIWYSSPPPYEDVTAV